MSSYFWIYACFYNPIWLNWSIMHTFWWSVDKNWEKMYLQIYIKCVRTISPGKLDLKKNTSIKKLHIFQIENLCLRHIEMAKLIQRLPKEEILCGINKIQYKVKILLKKIMSWKQSRFWAGVTFTTITLAQKVVYKVKLTSTSCFTA